MEEDYIRDFDEFMDSKNELLYLVPNINNEGGSRTLAIKRTYLSRSGIMKYIFSQNKGKSAPFMISITRLCLVTLKEEGSNF
jgi:hypothetical protein